MLTVPHFTDLFSDLITGQLCCLTWLLGNNTEIRTSWRDQKDGRWRNYSNQKCSFIKEVAFNLGGFGR